MNSSDIFMQCPFPTLHKSVSFTSLSQNYTCNITVKCKMDTKSLWHWWAFFFTIKPIVDYTVHNEYFFLIAITKINENLTNACSQNDFTSQVLSYYFTKTKWINWAGPCAKGMAKFL